MDKQAWRTHFKAIRAGITPEQRVQIDAKIAQRVCSLPEFESCSVVLPYLSFGTEIETRGIIGRTWEAGKTVALPRCVSGTRTMKWYVIDSFEGLECSKLGVEEPPEDPARELDPRTSTSALALVPGLTFDAGGFRMGYGGGFYDTFLKVFPGVSVGLCRECQLSDTVPALEAHDRAVQIIATEQRVIRVDGN